MTHRRSSQNQAASQATLLINALEAGASTFPHIPYTRSRSLSTGTRSDAPVPQSMEKKSTTNVETNYVMLTVAQVRSILNVDSATLTDLLAEYTVKKRDVFQYTCPPQTLT